MREARSSAPPASGVHDAPPRHVHHTSTTRPPQAFTVPPGVYRWATLIEPPGCRAELSAPMLRRLAACGPRYEPPRRASARRIALPAAVLVLALLLPLLLPLTPWHTALQPVEELAAGRDV